MKFKIIFLLFILSSLTLFYFVEERRGVEVSYNNLSTETGQLQVFFDLGDGFNENDSKKKSIKLGKNTIWFNFPLFQYPKQLRFDFLNKKDIQFEINSIHIKHNKENEYIFDERNFILDQLELDDGIYNTLANDPKIVINKLPQNNYIDASYIIFFFISLLLILIPNKFFNLIKIPLFVYTKDKISFFWTLITNNQFFSIVTLIFFVVVSVYPILFFGKSYDSPMGQALLSSPGSINPSIPGFDETQSHYDKFVGNDTGAFAWAIAPNQVAALKSIKKYQEFPYFNKYVGGGIANFAQSNNLILDPLNIFIYIFDGNSWGFDLKFIFSKLIFVLGIFFLTKFITKSDSDSLIIATMSIFIGYFHYRVQHPAIFSITYAPFLLHFWHRFKDSFDNSKYNPITFLSLIVLFNFLVINSGPLKEVSMIALMINLYGAALFLFGKPYYFKKLGEKFLILFILSLSIILVCSFNFILFLDYLSQNFSNYDAPSVTQMPLSYSLGFFNKELLRYSAGFSSNIFFLFVLVCFFMNIKKYLFSSKTMLAFIFFVINFSLAYQVIPWQLIIKIPFLNNIFHLWDVFTFPAFLFLILFSANFLVILRNSQFKKNKRLILYVFLTYLTLSIFYLYGEYINFEKVSDKGAIVIILTLFSLLLCFYIPKKNIQIKIFIGLICFINIFANTFHVKPSKFLDNFLTQPMNRGDYNFHSSSINFIKDKLKNESFRVMGFSDSKSSHVLFPGFNTRLGIDSVVPVDPIRNPNFNYFLDTGDFINSNNWNWLRLLNDSTIIKSRNLIDKLNVKYIISHRGVNLSDYKLEKIHSSDYDVWINKSYWPKSFSTNNVIIYKNEKQLKNLLKIPLKPFALIESNKNNNLAQPSTKYRLAKGYNYHETNNSISFTVDSTKGDIIVVNQNYYKDDYVFQINNEACKYFKVNVYMIGCKVKSEGLQQVTVEYKPKYANLSLYLTLSMIVFCLFLLISSIFKVSPLIKWKR